VPAMPGSDAINWRVIDEYLAATERALLSNSACQRDVEQEKTENKAEPAMARRPSAGHSSLIIDSGEGCTR